MAAPDNDTVLMRDLIARGVSQALGLGTADAEQAADAAMEHVRREFGGQQPHICVRDPLLKDKVRRATQCGENAAVICARFRISRSTWWRWTRDLCAGVANAPDIETRRR